MCNIAGMMIDATIVDVDPDEFDRIVAVNLKGVLYGCQAAGKVMVAQGGGSIVNMASAAVLAPAAGIGPYAITKAGVVQLTQTMALEVGKHGVRVNCVAPGFVPTNMTARYYTNPDGTINEDMKAAVLTPMSKSAPLRRVGETSDIAYCVLYLAADASSFVTGQLVSPNGGVSMHYSVRPPRHVPGGIGLYETRTRSNCPVVVSEVTTAGPGPSSVTAAPTTTASLTSPWGSIRTTHDDGAGWADCGQVAMAPPCSSARGPAAVSTTVLVTEPLYEPIVARVSAS